MLMFMSFRAKAKNYLEEKEQRSVVHQQSYKSSIDERMQQQKAKEMLLEKRAEQRRQLFEMERTAAAEALRVHQEVIAAQSEIHASIKFQRPNALKEAFKTGFHEGVPSEVSQRSLNPITPGPGEYNPESSLPRRVKGGFIAGRHSIGSIFVTKNTPGPGEYSPVDITSSAGGGAGSSGGARGALPFRSRGKTDVDWQVALAAKQPGPGDYDSPSRRLSGGKFSRSALPTEITRFVESKRYVPGPGAYETADVTETKPLKTIILQRALSPQTTAALTNEMYFS